MCFGGGGSNKAAEEANRAEVARQAAIADTQQRVNAVFDDPRRAAEIAAVVDAVRQQNVDRLNEQNADAVREAKFGLARSGQVGGSLQTDVNSRLSRAYQRGLLTAEQAAQGAGTRISQADEDARAQLISLATQGLDATTGAQRAGATMRNNLDAGRNEALAADIASSFGGVNDTFKRWREDYDRRRGLSDSGISYYGKVG